MPIQFTQTAINAQTFDWTFGKNLGTSTTNNPSFTFPEPGDYDIQLIVNKGNRCTDTIIKSIKTIDGITKTNFTLKDICVNAQQTFTNQSVAVKNDFSAFSWDFGNGTTSTDRSPRLPFSNPGTYTIQMIAETALGCRDSIQKSITIYPAPTVNFDNSDVCLNVENTFNNTSSIISGQIEKYQWTFGNLGSSTETNAPFTFAQSGNVNVRLTATSDFGCSANITKTVKIRPAAKVDFDYTNHCFKAPVFFTDKSTSTNNDIAQWIWTFEPGKTATGKNVQYVYSKAGSYEVTLVVVSNIGCRDSIIKTITIEEVPVAQFNIAGNNDENFTLFSCNGDYSVQFDNTSDTDLKYLWNFGWNNSTSTLRDGYFIYPDTGTYIVRLFTEPGTTCQDMMEKKVRVIPPVEFDFNFDTECVLAPVFFKSIYKRDFDPIVEALWNFGDGTTSTEFNPEKKYQRAGTYQVQLTLTATSGCSNTISKSITIQPEPKANFVTVGVKTNAGEFLKCEDLLGVTFNNTSSLNNTNHWYFNDNHASSLDVSPKHYFSDLGTFDVTLVINQGKICSDTITKTIDVVHGIEFVDFEFENSCVTKNIQFKDLSKARLNDIRTYLWDFGDNTTSAVKNPSKSYALPGDYTVKLYVTTANGCIDSTQKTITIYPAPVSYFDVSSICLHQELEIMNLSTISGGDIVSSSWTFQNSTNQTETNPTISYNQPGFYKITLTSVSDYGCIHTFEDILEVKIPAQPQFTYINQCVSAPVEFKDATTSSYNDIVAWEWTILTDVVLNTQNPTYTFGEAGTYPVQLTVISNSGCRDSVTQEIVTKPHPVADFVVDALDKGNDLFVYCNDDKTISFTNESIDNLTNLWTTSNAFSVTTEDASFTFPDIATYQVKLTINNGTLCSDTKEVQIVVQPTLNVNFTYPTVCEENAVIFTDESSIATNDITLRTWKVEEEEIGTGKTIPYTFEEYGNYLVTVIVETEKGCIESISKSVKVEALPIVEFNITEACPQQATQFDHQSQVVNNNPLTDFTWKFGDGNTSTKEKPSHIYDQPGSYELTFIVNTKAGCMDSIQEMILVRDLVEPIITTQVEILCQHQEIQFISDASKGIYQNAIWDFGDGQSSSELNDINIYNEGGDYEVTLILKDALCGEFKTSKEIFIQDVPEITLGPDFALCPNLTTTLDLNNNTLDSIFWSTGDINISQIVVNGNSGLVEVDAYYRGCLLEDSVYITPSCEVSAPKVFTPNGDGLNDYFNLMPPNVGTFQLFIFNRWGIQIFSTNDLRKGWDGTYHGKEQPMDNYTYYSVGVRTDGSPFTIEGAVMLIR